MRVGHCFNDGLNNYSCYVYICVFVQGEQFWIPTMSRQAKFGSIIQTNSPPTSSGPGRCKGKQQHSHLVCNKIVAMSVCLVVCLSHCLSLLVSAALLDLFCCQNSPQGYSYRGQHCDPLPGFGFSEQRTVQQEFNINVEQCLTGVVTTTSNKL